jgi:hypothetical protein
MSDTPRTDAAAFSSRDPLELMQTSQQLERELKAEIANREKCCRDGNRISDELFDTQLKLKKADAEVVRLTESLKHTELWGSFEKAVTAQLEITELKAEVERLKAILRTYKIPL